MEGKRILSYDPGIDSVQVFDDHSPDTNLSSEIFQDLVIDTNDSLWVILEQSIGVFDKARNRFHVFRTPHGYDPPNLGPF